MKSAFNILMGSVLLIVGLNIGTQWGLTAKPVQIVNQKPVCNDIIRYEDGSLVCEVLMSAEDDFTADINAFAGSRVTPQTDTLKMGSSDRQATANTMEHQPADTISRVQPTEVAQ